MKKISIILLLAIFGFQFPAFNPLQAQSTEKPDAIYKLIRQHYTVRRDGTTEYNYRKELTLLRNRAITAYADKGETFIVYNPAFQSLTINESYTIRKDGSRVQTPKRAFVEQLPSDCQSCRRFNGLVELAIVHTALEYDCTIVLDYTITSRTDILQQKIQLTQDCPVNKYEVIIDIPRDGKLYNHIDDNGCDIRQIADHHTLHIEATNLTQTFSDRYLPPAEDIYPTIYFSNIESLSDRMRQMKDNLPAAQLLILNDKDKIKKSGNRTEHERNLMLVEDLRDYVVDNIRTNNISPVLQNYDCDEPTEVWTSACGTPYEKALTLAALFRQAGFYSYVSLGETELTTTDDKKFHIVQGDMTTVNVVVDNEPLSLSAISKNPIRKVKQNRVSHRDIELTPTEADNGYIVFSLPMEDNPTGIDASYLTTKRTAPVLTTTCDNEYTYDIHLSTKATLMNPVENAYDITGLGSIKVSIKQNGDHIFVSKHIKIEKRLINTEDYSAFRQMMIDWSKNNTLYFKAK